MGNVSISDTPNGIIDVIKTVDRGELLLDYEEAMREVVDACIAQQKSGKVTLEIVFNPDSSTGAMRVGGKVKKVMPEKKSKESLFFVTPEGNLSRYDTRQKEMFVTREG